MDFLLVIPAFRESLRLPPFLEDLLRALDGAPYSVGIQVVDDGSGEQEQTALQKCLLLLQTNTSVLLNPILFPHNRGKGAAIRAGWENGLQARWLAFVDADGAISASEVRRLFDEIWSRGDGQTAIFASRVQMLGRKVERTSLRHLTGRLFATLVGYLIHDQVYDSQCGFKIIPASAYKSIQSWLQENGFAFDVELLAALAHAKVPLVEMPISWRDVPGSRVRFLRDSIRMARSVRRIRKSRESWTL